MWILRASPAAGLAIVLLCSRPGFSQDAGSDRPATAPGPVPVTAPVATSVSCASTVGQRTHCDAVTTSGVLLMRSTGASGCLLGKTWGYDNTGVWVAEGCSGEFQIGTPAAPPATAKPEEPTESVETWGVFDPGKGFLVGKSELGELAISGYALVRYVNQTPGEQTFTDHLGNTRTVDGRNDIWPHRVMVFMKGWMGNPKLIYSITYWTVLDTAQNAIFGNLGYQFSRKFSVYAGLNGNPGTRSLQGSHPLWLGQDRVLADEFFRPYFGSGVWVQGEAIPGLWYNAMVGGTNSILDVRATQLDRRYSSGASMWWMPTTKEFGPRGGYGDWEQHEKVATRFGFSSTWSPEQRFSDLPNAPQNTTLRLADSVNLFETGALASGVTVNTADYSVLAFDAGLKCRGYFLQTEIYNRWLDNFTADGPLPVASIHDSGFHVQGGFYPVPKKLEVYGATSQIYGDKAAGFSNSNEVLAGFNYYPTDSRYHRLNVQLIHVNRSPVSSTFGYYVGGQTGNIFSVGFSVFF